MFDSITSKLKGFFAPMKEKPDQFYKEEMIDHVTSEFEKRQQDKLPFELQWRLNINFFEGNQYLDINTMTNTVEEVLPLFWWQEREVFNQIAPIMETRLAKLSRLNPILKCRPATTEKEDISAAKVSNKILENTYSDLEMKRLQLKANVWSELTGTAIIKPIWNTSKGRRIGAYADEEKENEVFEGDIETTVVSPFEIYPDSSFSDGIEECQSIIHAKAYHVNDIENIWGVTVEGTEVNVFTVKENSVGLGGLGARGGNYSIASQKKKDQAIVYEYWERPSRKHPEGRLIICTDNELLHYGSLPYRVGRDFTFDLPFIFQKSLDKPHCIWGRCIIDRLIPLQRRYNALRNRKAEYLNRAAIGQLAYEEGSIDEDFLENDGLAPGTMIPFKRGAAPPTYMQYHALPHSFETEEQSLLADFNRISGVSEISRDSQAPTGINSGIALSILQEQDDTRLALTAKNLDNCVITLGKMWLRLYKQFGSGPRILKSVGKDQMVEVIEWSESDITSDDIYIETGTQLSESPAQRKQMVFDLLGSGLFNDPETGALSKEGRSKIFEMLEMGNWEGYDDETTLNTQKAYRENRKMMEGIPTDIADFDDDVVHLSIHNKYRLSSDYEELIEDNPELFELFNMHIQMHIESLNMKLQPQMQPMPGGDPLEVPKEEIPI